MIPIVKLHSHGHLDVNLAQPELLLTQVIDPNAYAHQVRLIILLKDHVNVTTREVPPDQIQAIHSLEYADHVLLVPREIQLMQPNVYAQPVKHTIHPQDHVNVTTRDKHPDQTPAIHLLVLVAHAHQVQAEVQQMLLNVCALQVKHTMRH